MYFLSPCVYDLKGQTLYISAQTHICCILKSFVHRNLLLETNKSTGQQTSEQSLLISAFEPVTAQAGLSLT